MEAQADKSLCYSHMPEDISALRGSSILVSCVTLNSRAENTFKRKVHGPYFEVKNVFFYKNI